MPFGTRRRTRQVFRFIDPVIVLRKSEELKIKEISKQGLENTSQREDVRPSAKSFIQPIIQDDKPVKPKSGRPIEGEFGAPPKLSALEDKLLKRLESGDVNLTDKELEIVGKIQKRVDASPTIIKSSHNSSHNSSHTPQEKVLQIIVDKVKTNIKKVDNKIKSLSAKGLRSQVEKEIKLKEQQLSKLRTLLAKCPNCN